MAAGSWTATNNTRTKTLDGTFDFDSDSFKCALVTSSSNIGASSGLYSALTGELSTANGYTSGGIAVTLGLSGTTSVTVTPSANIEWTASGGSIAARYAVLYEVGGNIAAYLLLDSTPADVTATTGNKLTISNSVAVFTLA